MSKYTTRLCWVAGCLMCGFAILCVSGWFLVMDGSAYDPVMVKVLRWIPIITGVSSVLYGFYLMRKPMPESPDDFFYSSDDEGKE